jgi:hypothetical protein
VIDGGHALVRVLDQGRQRGARFLHGGRGPRAVDANAGPVEQALQRPVLPEVALVVAELALALLGRDVRAPLRLRPAAGVRILGEAG